MGEASSVSHPKMKKVMVFCDGTWCGQLTGTDTNVKLLADAVAGTNVNSGEGFVSSRYPGIVGCYFDGEGVEGGFSDYILDGALGGRIKQDCLDAYKFLMREFEQSENECEAWLIGLSRGSYTVRCVGGMINNCGLISRKVIAPRMKHGHPSKEEMNDILNRAYDYYRDRTNIYKPDSEFMKQWKRDHSQDTPRPPIKFMGLFETVGALGIPSLNPGEGVDYLGDLNFNGKQEEGASAVSGEVERVYQALAVHDRFAAFSPCHVKRDKTDEEFSYNKDKHLNIVYETKELWFPGAHYDIGRQKFMFYKSPKLFTPNLWEMSWSKRVLELRNRFIESTISFLFTRLLQIPDIHPNYAYSTDVLHWMMKRMSDTDPETFGTLRELVGSEKLVSVTSPDSWAHRLLDRLTFKPTPLGSDAYDHLVEKKYLTIELLPFGHQFLVGLLNRYLLKDRTICDPPHENPAAPPVRFYVGRYEPGTDPTKNLESSVKYRSRSFDSYLLECTMQGKKKDTILVQG